MRSTRNEDGDVPHREHVALSPSLWKSSSRARSATGLLVLFLVAALSGCAQDESSTEISSVPADESKTPSPAAAEGTVSGVVVFGEREIQLGYAAALTTYDRFQDLWIRQVLVSEDPIDLQALLDDPDSISGEMENVRLVLTCPAVEEPFISDFGPFPCRVLVETRNSMSLKGGDELDFSDLVVNDAGIFGRLVSREVDGLSVDLALELEWPKEQEPQGESES